MNISIGCDHGGFALKEKIRAYLEEQGHTVTDVGCKSLESCDYPDFGAAAARLTRLEKYTSTTSTTKRTGGQTRSSWSSVCFTAFPSCQLFANYTRNGRE